MNLHFLENGSSYAGDVDQLVWIITVLVGVWFIAAEAMFFWLLFRFRARDGVKSLYITGKEKHLKRWINIPHTLILFCDVIIIVAAVRVWMNVKQTLPKADETVRVIGQQWTWTFQHAGLDGKLDTADDITTTDSLHVQVDRTYHFQLESKDVLHSFFVPVFRLKQDAVPGRVITGWFRASRTGVHDILCAEICGIGHGVMGARIVIESPEQHRVWLQAHSVLADAGASSGDSTTAKPAASSN
jgi:cytochrome c oxidase subunit 2